MNEMFTLKKQKSQSGQAVVEVVLLLAIGVALILGLATQFYQPFGNWMKDYMGPYLECLLDVGELPTIGASSSGGGECTTKLKFPANAAAGSPGAKSQKSSSSDDPLNHRSSSSNDSSESGRGAGGGSYRSNGRSRSFSLGKGNGADGAGSSSDSKQMTEPLPSQSNYFKLASSKSTFANSSSSKQGSREEWFEVLKQGKRTEKAPKSLSIKADADSDAVAKAKKLKVTTPERKVASEEEQASWSFAKYIKFGIIVLIIIAIVLFLGGQILQISKSMEK